MDNSALRDDPYPVYARHRAAAPLSRGPAGSWIATRHSDVAALLRDRRFGSQFPPDYYRLSAGNGAASAFFERIILYRDPPGHTRLRRLLGQAFGMESVRALEPRISGLVDELLEPALDSGQLDAAADLAFPLPVMVVSELMGIPHADQKAIRPRALALSRGFAAVVPDAARAEANEAVDWLRDYLGVLLEERRRLPGNDLLSSMLAAEEGDDRLTHDEIVDNAVFSFFAGFETTTNLIGTGCAALMQYPGQLARLREDASLIPLAVEEFLRYDAPIQGVARIAHVPVEIGERTIRKGRVLILLLGSANRDERAFARPDQLDVGRNPNPHVSFGAGIHGCMGQALARVEAKIVFLRLLERFGELVPAGAQIRQENTSFRGYASVPIATKAR
jgi:cytochrome P450